MGKYDALVLGGVALGALFMFKKDINQAITEPVSQVTSSVGDVAQTASRSIKDIGTVTGLIPTSTTAVQDIIVRESREADTRSIKRQKKDIVKLDAQIERQKVQEKFKDDITKTSIKAGKDVARTFRSAFRPTPSQITQRRASLKKNVKKVGSTIKRTVSNVASKAKSLKRRIFGKKIFGRG